MEKATLSFETEIFLLTWLKYFILGTCNFK